MTLGLGLLAFYQAVFEMVNALSLAAIMLIIGARLDTPTPSSKSYSVQSLLEELNFSSLNLLWLATTTVFPMGREFHTHVASK